LRRICAWYSRNEGAIASFRATALAAITCISGPPWIPGKMAEFSFLAWSSRHRIMPERGPRSVLWVVVVTNSQCGTGLGCSPAATIPAMWAISAITMQPASSAISRNFAKSMMRG